MTTPKALGLGLGVAAGMSVASIVERGLANATARAMARVLPGREELWRPVGHAVALAGLGGAARFVAQRALSGIEHKEESIETAFDIPPPNPLVSGSFESRVSVRHHLEARPAVRLDRHVRRDDPHRSWARSPWPHPSASTSGLESAPSESERVALVLDELERTDAFEPLLGDGRLADRHRVRQLRRSGCARAAQSRGLRDGRDAVLGAPVRVVTRPRERGPGASPHAARCAPRPPRSAARGPAPEGGAVRGEPRRLDEPGSLRRPGHRRVSSTPASTTPSGSAPRTSASGRSRSSTTNAPTSTRRSCGVFSNIDEWTALDPADRARTSAT